MLRTIMKTFSRPLLVLIAAAGLAACEAPDGTTQAPDTALVAGLMSGLGAVDPHAKPIEYAPRAPLAMPSNMDSLPQPETRVAGKDSPSWPQSQQNKDLAEIQEIYKGTDRMHSGVLRSEQMRGINIRNDASIDRLAESRDQQVISGDKLSPAELRAQNSSANTLSREVAGNSNEAGIKRRYLTDPPTKYSQSSDGSKLPEVKEDPKDANYDPFDGRPLDMKCLEETGGTCQRGNN
ncbi:hypothetical protein [Roseibium litorale]|uniref:Lipoprotein n=1 Tax=Roseibium litorale TaxID=2803841 RepID=A0ABR9CRS5_9HYPH|nr:hypothetical protein [Roseibium litorale]MBD8892961.1 hypothetical protein [Roseibium litorale]